MDLTAAQTPGGASGGAMDSGDWRTQLPSGSRERIVNKITKELKRHIPFSGQDGESELMKIAVKFEEKVYNAATSQEDYLRKIAIKMLTMEIKSKDDVVEEIKRTSSGAKLDERLAQVEERLEKIEAHSEKGGDIVG
uniref:Transcription cofactor n=1 Tax=Solanum tuberosum TaxID=4113 RepID=M1DJT8_SOLTU